MSANNKRMVVFINIGFIGAGKVGTALGLYFQKHQLNIKGYYSKTALSAKKAALTTTSKQYTDLTALLTTCDVIFITTTDMALPVIAAKIAQMNSTATIFFHTSGAHSSDILSEIKKAGNAIGSIHPLQSFADINTSALLLEKTFFTIEGMPAAINTAKNILQQTGGKYCEITSAQKPLYHTGASILANYLITVISFGMDCLEQAGLNKSDLLSAIEPLLRGTIDNILDKGPTNALTGPIVRSDVNTVNLQLQAIKKNLPEKEFLFRSLSLATVDMIKNKRLDEHQATVFYKLLKGYNNHE